MSQYPPHLYTTYIITINFFEKQKPLKLIKIPFSDRNEKNLKDFIQKFHKFTNSKVKISIK